MAELNDTNTSSDGQDTVTPASSKEEEIQQKLTAAAGHTAKAEVLAQLMQDPEFRALQAAKAAGKKVLIVDADQQKQPTLAEELVPLEGPEVDLDKLSTKELQQHFMRETVKVMEKAMDRKLAPVLEQVGGVQRATESQAREKSKQVFEATQAKYPDFDEYLPRMAELNTQHPGLNPSQLYAIAKTEKGSPIVEARHTSSERPGSITTRPPARTTRKTPLPPGMLGLRELIREKANKLKASGVLQAGLGEEDVEED